MRVPDATGRLVQEVADLHQAAAKINLNVAPAYAWYNSLVLKVFHCVYCL